MTHKKSWHDYTIIGYSVDGIKREIIFHLLSPLEPKQTATIIFKEVQGYELSKDSMGSIILDFEESELSDFFEKHKADIQRAYTESGAYGAWAADLNLAKEKFEREQMKAYTLASTIGLEGWIISKSVEEQ